MGLLQQRYLPSSATTWLPKVLMEWAVLLLRGQVSLLQASWHPCWTSIVQQSDLVPLVGVVWCLVAVEAGVPVTTSEVGLFPLHIGHLSLPFRVPSSWSSPWLSSLYSFGLQKNAYFFFHYLMSLCFTVTFLIMWKSLPLRCEVRSDFSLVLHRSPFLAPAS